jgi:hypothetical protein
MTPMMVSIYGIVGHAGAVEIPLDDLEIDELEVGREFLYRGKIYEVRSINDSSGQVIRMNVVITMDPSDAGDR